MWAHKDWKGKVYPHSAKPSDYLEYYSEKFSAIELNSTFYHLPKAETLSKWMEVTPKKFRFCPKVPQQISHVQKLRDCKFWISETVKSFSQFGDKLGVVFLQLPPSFSKSEEKYLKEFLGHWSTEIPLAVEFRHSSWFEKGKLADTTFRLLQNHDVGCVVSDVPGRRDVLHMSHTSRVLFVRFLGFALHKSDSQRLNEWSYRIKDLLEKEIVTKVIFFLHQPDDILAPETICLFQQTLNENCDLRLEVPELFFADKQKSLF